MKNVSHEETKIERHGRKKNKSWLVWQYSKAWHGLTILKGRIYVVKVHHDAILCTYKWNSDKMKAWTILILKTCGQRELQLNVPKKTFPLQHFFTFTFFCFIKHFPFYYFFLLKISSQACLPVLVPEKFFSYFLHFVIMHMDLFSWSWRWFFFRFSCHHHHHPDPDSKKRRRVRRIFLSLLMEKSLRRRSQIFIKG